MARTDKTLNWKLVHARGECSGYGGYPCPCLSSRGVVQMYRRKLQRHERTRLRLDLAAGRDPQTSQHRHRAIWEAW